MAKFLNCHTAYISLVLKKKSHFSLEQAEKINRFLGHNKEESKFFLTLVLYNRAGTSELEEYYKHEVNNILKNRLTLKNRLKIKKTLSLEDQATYYSSWYYGAIHIALTIPHLREKELLANFFSLPQEKVAEVLSFLRSVSLAKYTDGKYFPGESYVHLGSDSPNIAKHHTNWLIQALKSLEKNCIEDFHYSSFVTLSNKDAIKLKEKLIRTVQEFRKVIRASECEETTRCISFHYFS